jgi:hypothetical protein
MEGPVTPVVRLTALRVPELGPALGRLVAPPPPPPGVPAHWIRLEDIRVALVSQLFELLADARRWAREGERELALATLNREAWEGAWSRALQEVADRAGAAISDRMLAAAREARLPSRQQQALPLDAVEIRALAARLGHGSAALHQVLTALDQAAHFARSERAPEGAVQAWQDALATAARRLEAAWLALEDALGREWRSWEGEVEDLRRWRRPLWPLIVAGLLLFGLALYAGLLLGGYLPVPGPLKGPVEALWARWS